MKKLFVSGDMVITPIFVGKTVQVYNGLRMFSFVIQKNMLGHKFGEYIRTKRCGYAIHYSGRKKKGGVKSGRRK
jgi:ribosomal protein S19